MIRDEDRLERCNLPDETARWIQARVGVFLGQQALALTRANLLNLLGSAYVQGANDAVQALVQTGKLPAPEDWPGGSPADGSVMEAE